ncbi:MAG: DUF945 family protein, partial [Gammaproteobacteria bacterium]
VNTLFNLLPPESRSQLQIEETQFSSGWFSSQLAMEIRYNPLASDDLFLRLDFDISHGPIVRTDDGLGLGLAYASITPSLEESLQQDLEELPFTLPPITITLHSRLDRSMTVRLDMASLEYLDGDRELLFGGLNGELLAQADRSARLNFAMNSLQARDIGTGVAYSMGGFSIQSNTRDMSNILASSSGELSIREISSTGIAELSIGEIHVNSRLQPAAGDADEIDILQQLAITDVSGDIPLSSLTWDSELLGIKGEVARRYVTLTSGLQTQANANSQAVQLFQELALLVLQNPFTFNNQFDAIAYGGDHAVVLDLDWAGLPEVDSFGALDSNELLNALEINLDVSLNLDAIMRSPAADLVDPYVQEGYIVIDNGRVRT